MIVLTATDVAQTVGGGLHGDGTVRISRVTIDSRAVTPGDLFVAIKGKRTDGHRFVDAAVNNGAGALLVHEAVTTANVPVIQVNDTTQALGRLGAYCRQAFGGQVAAITGSSGKTTTRTLLATILKEAGRVHQPVANFNNHIGVPLTLFELPAEGDYAVIELGCSDFKEIDYLARMVKPHVALVTNVGAAHLENLKNLDGVARAKGELFAALDVSATAVVNLDDPWVAAMAFEGKKITYGSGPDGDVRLLRRQPQRVGQLITIDLQGTTITVPLALPGAHNAQNGVAAAAMALALGIPADTVATGLSQAVAVPGRLNLIEHGKQVIIDDTYNANPKSMAAALATLAEMPTDMRVAVLGDMLELGERTGSAHRQLGQLVVQNRVDYLVVKGEMGQMVIEGAVAEGMAPKRCHLVPDDEAAVEILSEISKNKAVLLIKGSRGMAMEKIVQGLLKG